MLKLQFGSSSFRVIELLPKLGFAHPRLLDGLPCRVNGGNLVRRRVRSRFSGTALRIVPQTELLQGTGAPTEVLDVGTNSLDLVMRARQLVGQGVFLGMLGDRALPGMPEIALPFLGRTARFPVGPYRLAAALRCPLVALFSVREGPRRHVLHTRVLSEAVALPRGNRDKAIESLAREYVTELERFCRRAPHQWYNFYDFWATAPA